MDPSGPSQPSLDSVYTTPGNPADTTSSESATADRIESSNAAAKASDRGARAVRRPHDQAGAEPASTSLGAGTASSGSRTDQGRQPANTVQDELEGEQMGAGGEGAIMQAQFEKTGMGEEKSLTSDLDRKKEEQRGAREEVAGMRKQNVDVDGALGQRGGPANVEGR